MQSTHKQIYQACLLTALSGILYGFLGYFGTKAIEENMSIQAMLFWRFFIAGIWILLFSLKSQSFKQLSILENKMLLFVIILGAFSYAGASLFYFLASQYTGTGLAMAIFFSYPLAIAGFSWCAHKKKLNSKIILLLVAMLLGLFFLSAFSSEAFSLVGVLFGLLAAISYASYLIGGKAFAHIAISNISTIVLCCSCAMMFLALALSTHSFSFPHSLRAWFYLLALGVFATALPIQLMLVGLKHISAMRASIISLLEPVVTIFVGMLWLNEVASLLQILGVVIILSSAMLMQAQQCI